MPKKFEADIKMPKPKKRPEFSRIKALLVEEKSIDEGDISLDLMDESEKSTRVLGAFERPPASVHVRKQKNNWVKTKKEEEKGCCVVQ